MDSYSSSLIPLIFSATVHGSDSDSDGFSELFIDCGASGETTISFNGVDTHWYEDKDFINTGKNFILTPTEVVNPMNSLRFFPSDNKSCYKLPLQPFNGKFLFRAGFFYGNYDGLSRPSSFKLEIDGNLWANVTTSMIQDQPVYHELIYRTASEKTTVCLVRTTDNGVAFISSLQATYMPGDMYTLMQNKTALYLQSRINFGANKTVE